MKSIKLLCTLALILILLPAADGFSCTSVMAAKNGMVLAGNNKDMDSPRTQVTFMPAATGRFGYVYFSYDDGWPRSGMNDQGLFLDANDVTDTGWRADPAKQNFPGDPRLHILWTCATVADVRKFFETYNVPLLNGRRFPVADRSGVAMVVEYAGGSVRFVTEKAWYQVSTNFLRTDYPGTEVPCDRFRVAQQILDLANELSVSLIRSMLSATHQEGEYPTLYSNIYDLKAGLIYVYYFHNFEEAVVFKLEDELKKGACTIELSMLFPVQPYVAKQFQMKPSYPVLMDIYDQKGATVALTYYEQMCLVSRRVSEYDIGPEEIARLAKAMLERGDVQTALVFYIELSRYFPDSWQAYAGIGRAQMTLNNKTEAIAAFRRSLAINRDNPWAADMVKELEKELEEQPKLIGKGSAALTKETLALPPAVLLPVPNRFQEPDAPDLVWDGEICIQMGMAYYKKEVSQKAICSAGKPLKSSLNGYEIDTALEALGIQCFSWDWRNRDMAQFLAWIKTNLAKGYPVLCGIKMNPTRHPEWSLDLFVLVVGYNEGGLFIDTNINGDGRILATYSQLASLINRYSFENKDHRYFGRAFLGVKESDLLAQSQEPEKNVVPSPASVKSVPEPKPVVIDSSKLKRLTGRYTTGGQSRFITFDGEKLFSHWEGENLRLLIPLSETEFRFWDSQTRLRFEVAGDRVIGVIRCPANGPADPLEKRVEPIEDKDLEVTTMVQKFIREAIDRTLKPETFPDNLAAQIFPDQVKEAGAFFKSLGLQTGIELYEREEQGSVCRYLYRLSYGNKIVALRLSVLEDKRISKVDFYLE